MKDYGLDMHCQMILEEYREKLPVLENMLQEVLEIIRNDISAKGMMVASIEGRVKTEASLAGKLELKGSKYLDLSDITDIVGCRVVTFYTDDVDKVAAMAENLFEIDRENSVDKRKMHQLDSFGYNSLHYICRIPNDDGFRFELQIRTALQHVWATLNHDTGYKSGVEVPREYIRNINRLAGMLELADEQISLIRTGINDYRRRVQSLVADGRLEEVGLDGDTFRSYLASRPYDELNRRIAAVNQAEIQETSLQKYFPLLKGMGFKTLGDVDAMLKDCGDDAYRLATFQLGATDLDIISSTVALQNLCIVKILRAGMGEGGIKYMLDTLNGPLEGNASLAALIYRQAKDINLI